MISKHAGVATFTLTSPIGDLELTCCRKGVHRLSLPEQSFNSRIKPDLSVCVELKQVNGSVSELIKQTVNWLQMYFSTGLGGNLPTVCVLSDSRLESFTTVVYQRLVSNIPCGQTVSYRDLARLSGNVRASRAVGQAMRRNPVPLLIPCHRVIHSNGQAGHYSGGRRDFLKQWLLMLEKSHT